MPIKRRFLSCNTNEKHFAFYSDVGSFLAFWSAGTIKIS
jgi:hypothetical protein